MSSLLDFNENLTTYYKYHFPYQLIHDWLDYKDGRKESFRYREFSFTLQGDIYIRYQAFHSSLELKNNLLYKTPLKIDIGAVYNISPKQARAYPHDYKPLEHELVFDIDISDYDDVRTCCKESGICNKCWPFMKIGAKILHTVLTHEFGFRKLLFVYSGRRGFHCWVCDKEARLLGQDGRRAIADYFAVVVGGQSIVKRVTLNPNTGLHPMISKALKVIDEDFEDLMIDKQDFLANENLVQYLLDLCEEEKSLQELLRNRCKFSRLSSRERWNLMVSTSSNYHPKKGRNYFIEEVKLQHCFPRLDANVTKGMNHLLKLPFCIHPKTGNVCVPIDIEKIDKFDLSRVPRVDNLTEETLEPYVEILRKFVKSLDYDDDS